MDNYIGRILDDRYEILEVIGTGGMAVVYKALCHRLNRLVAVKILKDEFSKDPDFHRRFHAESQAVAMLSHPNIVSVYDVSQNNGVDYIVMELIEGITMKQYLDKKGIMTWREALHFSIQIAKGLEHAHSRGIIHRDIKPHNIMVLKDGSVKVADFGIARIASAQNTLTREALGSVHYISPEQAKGGRVDNRTDIYSLGVVMYEMVTGRPPYDGESPVAVAIQHINGNLIPPSTLNSQIPRGFEQIIMRCMQVNPDDRYPSATALLQDMEEFRRNPAVIFTDNGAVAPAKPAANVTRPTPAAQSPEEQKMHYAPARREAKTEPQPEKKNIAAVVAIVACVVVLLGAIIALATLGSCNSNPSADPEVTTNAELHTIPKFVGQQFADIRQEDYPFLKFETEEENSSEEKGKVIRQSLEANAEIKGDRTILLTISLGQKTETLVDLSGQSREDAQNWLLALKMGIEVKTEMVSDNDVKAGNVVRTQPASGAVLSAGDTVTLYISSGKEDVEVPKVVGMSISNAYALLTNEKYNFKVDYEYTTSEEPRDTVISQNLEKGLMVKQGTSIMLTVSNGVAPTEPTQPPTEAPTEPPTEAPTEPEKHTVTITMNFTPMDTDATVELRLANTIVVSGVLKAGETELQLTLEGSGKVTYDVYINGVFSGPETVDFNE